MMNCSESHAASQTVWTFPPLMIVPNCSLPHLNEVGQSLACSPQQQQRSRVSSPHTSTHTDTSYSDLSYTSVPDTSCNQKDQRSSPIVITNLHQPSPHSATGHDKIHQCSPHLAPGHDDLPSAAGSSRKEADYTKGQSRYGGTGHSRLSDAAGPPPSKLLRVETTGGDNQGDRMYDAVSSSTSPDCMSSRILPPSRITGTGYAETTGTAAIQLCQVCGDTAAGFHCGAFVCEACKKFYLRAMKQTNRSSMCCKSAVTPPGVMSAPGSSERRCQISKHSRTSCSYCRFQKCLSIGMEPPGKGLLDTHKVTSLPCKVCGASSSGFHFGVLTCEGCKGFFRRLIQDGVNSKIISLVCQNGGHCDVDTKSRSLCRSCRYSKCLSVGMSKNAARVGRQPNSVRYARLMANRPVKEESPDIKKEPTLTSDYRMFQTTATTIQLEQEDDAEELPYIPPPPHSHTTSDLPPPISTTAPIVIAADITAVPNTQQQQQPSYIAQPSFSPQAPHTNYRSPSPRHSLSTTTHDKIEINYSNLHTVSSHSLSPAVQHSLPTTTHEKIEINYSNLHTVSSHSLSPAVQHSLPTTTHDKIEINYSNLHTVSSHSLSPAVKHSQSSGVMVSFPQLEEPEITSSQMHSDHRSHAVDLTLKSPGSIYQNKELLDRLLNLFIEYRESYKNDVTDEEVIKPEIVGEDLLRAVYDGFLIAAKCYLSFLKRIDGFDTLCIDDRVTLTKCSIYRNVLILCSTRYDLETGRHYVFGWRSWREGPQKLVDTCCEYQIVLDHMKHVVKRIRKYNFTNMELALAAVLNVLNKDCVSDLEEKEVLLSLHSRYMALLATYVYETHENPEKRMVELHEMISICKTAATEHARAAISVTQKYPQYSALQAKTRYVIPQLYRDLFGSAPPSLISP